MRFENAITPSPTCVPARASLAAGRYVHQTGGWDNAMMVKDGIGMAWASIRREGERLIAHNRMLGDYVSAGTSYSHYGRRPQKSAHRHHGV
ncbi:hypothetical protein RM543_04965 [Roseicyclus sp. F158]|uniref:Sulfatase N-terminal domain-containing protein n=1 Tax=Tropicimonas omnivorans TaxID=3075590 RepID=A0ABU3DE79_9RHOB|nr:hypothetical protein [Roseicyclus sp. F158]MDT0682026.1 hypothetical protein [Roseicyclus sp. F158]